MIRHCLAWIVVVSILVAVTGCELVPPQGQPDAAAIATIVQAVYGDPVGAPTLFLGADDEANPLWADARSFVAAKVHAKVLSLSDRVFADGGPPYTPLDPDTGQAGVTVALGRFNVESGGQLRVTVSFVRQVGAERGCREFVLARNGGSWTIINEQDARANCPLSNELADSYEVMLARIRAGECFGLGAIIGTCGPWLVITQHHIDAYQSSYFAPETHLLVAQYEFGFPDEGWSFGYVDCDNTDFVETEHILCGTRAEP